MLVVAGIFSAVFVFCWAAVALSHGVNRKALPIGLGCACVLALAAAPPVAIERRAAKLRPSVPRDALAFAGVAVTIFAGLIAAGLQIFYGIAVRRHGDPLPALLDVETVFRTSLDFTGSPYLSGFVLMTSPFPVAAVARLRQLELGWQVCATILVSSLLSVPTIVVWLGFLKGAEAAAFVVVVPAYFATVPLGLACADRLDTWLAGRLAREAD